MEALLTSDLCGWPSDRVETLQDMAAPPDLARKLVELTEGVQDVLLLYYVGHGMRMANGQLALALRDTSSNRALLRHTAMVYKDIADILRSCPATTKLVILDCCHAELGNRASDQFQSADIDAEPVDGLYCIWASKEREKARSPVSGGLTYFTGEFVDVVRTGIPGKPAQLTIDQIFTELRARLLRANLPEPAQSGIRDASHWRFARNAARPETHRDPDREIALLLEQAAAAEARERALQTQVAEHAKELERLKAQASNTGHMTAEEKEGLRSAISTTERLLDDSVAAEVAARPEYPGPSVTSSRASVRPMGGRHRNPSIRDGARAEPLGDRYELEDVVGQGSMAEVYRARDAMLDRIVAIKILRAEFARDQTFQARFLRGAQSAASLNNPSIVAVYDTGEDRSAGVPVPYFVMEYVDGRTVRDLLTDFHRLLPERAIEIIAGVLRALEYSHQAGVVHRDIKPGNVMISRNGDVKVMDFGIAFALSASRAAMTPTGQILGTALYMSPEQARGERVDSRSDLYSTGCLMYELLTGRPPFTGELQVAIADQHVRKNPVPPSRLVPDIPPWADAIVLNAMAKSPNERYQTAAEMLADLERAASGMQVAAMTPPRARADSDWPTQPPQVSRPSWLTGWRRLRGMNKLHRGCQGCLRHTCSKLKLADILMAAFDTLWQPPRFGDRLLTFPRDGTVVRWS